MSKNKIGNSDSYFICYGTVIAVGDLVTVALDDPPSPRHYSAFPGKQCRIPAENLPDTVRVGSRVGLAFEPQKNCSKLLDVRVENL